jgi:hypothetical protein
MGVFGVTEQVALEIDELVIVAVADVSLWGCPAEVGVGVIDPRRQGAGAYPGVGRKVKGKGQDKGSKYCRTHVVNLQKKGPG